MAEQFELAQAVINVRAQDNASAVIDQSMKKSQQSIQTGAQVIRNSVNSVTRGLGSSIGPAITPLVGIGEAFTIMSDRAEASGHRIIGSMQGIGAAGIAVGAELTILNANEKQATDQLANAIANTGGSYDEYKGKIEEVINTQEGYGHSTIQTQQALNTLVNATHDTAQATNLMGESADLAAARHISLNNAAAQLARGLGGSGRIFKQFGIQQEYTAAGTLNLTAMNEKLAKVLNGQAAAAADNWGGRLRAVGVRIEDLMAKLGKFGPEIMAASSALLLYSTVVQAALARSAAAQAKALAEKEAATAAEVKASAETAQAELESAAAIQRAEEKKAESYAAAGEVIQKYQMAIAVGDQEEVAAMDAAYARMDELQLGFSTGDKELTASVIADAEARAAARDAEAGMGGAANGRLIASNTAEAASEVEKGAASEASAGKMMAGTMVLAAAAAGLIYGGMALSKWLDKQHELWDVSAQSDKMIKQLTASLEANAGASDSTNRSWIASQLTSTGLGDSLAKAGVSTNAATEAIANYNKTGAITPEVMKKLGADSSAALIVLINAYKKANATASEFSDVQAKVDMSAQATTDTLSTFATQLGITDKQANTYLGTLGIVADKNGNFAQSNHEVQSSLAAVTGEYNTANEAQRGYLDGLDKFAKSGGNAQDRASLIGETLKAANGDALGYAGALSETTKAVHTMTDAFKSQADAITKGNLLYKDSERAALKFTGTGKNMTATINTQAAGASDLVGQLQGMQDAAMKAAEAEYQHNVQTEGGKKAADDAYNVYVNKTSKQLEDSYKAMGLNKDQAKALAKQYFGIPSDVKSKIEQEGADSVTNILEQIELTMRSIAEHKTVAQILAEDKASGTLNALETKLYNLEHTPHVLTVITNNVVGVQQSSGRGVTGKQSKATGGQVHGPGTATSDSIPAMLSNEEFVVNAEQAKKNLPLLTRINNGENFQMLAKGGKAVTGWQPGMPYPTLYDSAASASKASKTAKAKTDPMVAIDWKIGGSSDSDIYKVFEHLFGAVASLHGSLATMINDVRKATLIGKAPGSLIPLLQREDNELIKEANARAVIATKLKTANANLAAQQKLYNDEVINAQKQIEGNFDLSNVGSQTTGGSFANLIAGMQQQVVDSTRFAKELKTLSAEGLNKDLYAQLLQGGPNSANAKVLANATQTQVNQINGLYSQISTVAHTGAVSAASEMYGSGVAMAQGIVKGLQSQEAALNKQMAKMADTMVAQIKKDLKIHSPSAVGHDIGDMFGEGIGRGLDTHQSKLQRRAGALADAMVNGASGGAIPSSGYGGNLTVEKFVLHVQELKDVEHLLKIIHGLPQAIRAGVGG